jgi:mono/diheme cytochrome c family protein
MNRSRKQTVWAAITAVVPCIVAGPLLGAESAAGDAVSAGHGRVVPLVKQYCQDCHAGDLIEGEVDLSGVGSLDAVRRQVKVWQRVAEMVSSRQMPPPEADQPTDQERAEIGQWLHDFLKSEARARAGDPGRVVLRRLNNAEYTYTIRDLTGVDSLDPAKEFPADGGAGEGFTNTGQSLVMSPALVTKYLDAAKAVASHAVLLPDGFRFSAGDTRRDWTDEALARVREFYGRFTQPLDAAAAAAQKVVKQGITLDVGHEGFLPTEKYLLATLAERDRLAKGGDAVAEVARERGLNPKYLATLWNAFSASDGASAGGAATREPSLILDSLRSRWKTATPEDTAVLAASVASWQSAVWKFNNVGQIARQFGRPDGPPSWMEAVTPLVDRQEFRVKLAVPEGQDAVTIRLATGDAGDGRDQDFVVWENPRLVAPGRADLPLRLVRQMVATLATQRERLAATASECLAAGAEAAGLESPVTADTLEATVADLSRKHAVDPQILSGWLSYLGIGVAEPQFAKLLDKKLERIEGWAAVNGWGGAGPLQVIANSSDEQFRIPGTMKPHGVAVHPEVKQRVIVGWRSPISATVQITGGIEGVHVGCSNGTLWSLQVWRGATRQVLASGTSNAGQPTPIGPFDSIELRRGDVVSVVVGARDGNQSCDLTAVDLTIRSGDQEWDLANDVSADILAANPHADRRGNAQVWYFASEPDAPDTGWTIPAGSLLARWMSATAGEERGKLTTELEGLLADDGADGAKDSPDAELRRMLLSATGPLLARIELQEEPEESVEAVASEGGGVGIDPKIFGVLSQCVPTDSPVDATVDAKDLCVHAPFSIDITIPAELAAGCELVTAGKIHPQAGDDASVQLQVSVGSVADAVSSGLSSSVPVLARKDSAVWQRFDHAFADLRSLFPKALCYARIVPVDEVVTLNLFYREDGELKRLMLDDNETKELDRLWNELLFISQEPVELVDVFEQLMGYASQDRSDLVKSFEPIRGPLEARAAAFRREMTDAEPVQLAQLHAFAAQAYRRPLRPEETRELNELYAELRRDDLPHEQAFALTLARVLVAPAFLYKAESPGPGTGPQPVSDAELATRLSYFLWSSLPDAELLETAAAGRLHEPETLLAQTRRMLRDGKARRLAEEFGTQWLHVHGFAEHDEKSEEVFPTFAALRGAMEEETILFLADFLQNDRSILSLLDADHTFLNEELAKHYSIAGVAGPQWRRVDGVRQHGRGGILGLASTLATQAGASRTSPILRGNWLSEVILGEKLPKPPKNVPLLAETVPEGLTERQLIARHSSDAACAKCHMRIDPFGFALEKYDAIGRFRTQDAAGLPIDAATKLMDGTPIDGPDGLRSYLLNDRRDTFERQFCRKLLGYALGRAVQLSDEPLLDEIQARLAANGHRVHVAIEAIVSSPQFRDIRGADAADDGE